MTPSPHLSRRLPFRLLQRLAARARVRVGPRILRVPTHDPAALGWIFWTPSWKTNLLAHFLRRREGAFIDIGVNTGQTLADFLSTDLARPYVGLEPNPQCVAFVESIVGLNRLRDITILPLGASTTRGLHPLFVSDDCSTDQTATLRADLRPAASRRATWVNTLPLDETLAAASPGPLSLVKIDVEGAELDVLQGAPRLLAGERPPILCEVLLADPRADFDAYLARLGNLASLLRSHDYSIHQIIKRPGPSLPALRPLDTFPPAVWTPARADDCDYLLTPRGLPLDGFEISPSP